MVPALPFTMKLKTLQCQRHTRLSHCAVWLILGFSTLPEDWQRHGQKGLFTDIFYFICHNDVISISSGILRAPFVFVCMCGSVFVFMCTPRLDCVWLCMPACVYMYLMWDEVSYGDWGILLPSIEPQETELIEIFLSVPTQMCKSDAHALLSKHLETVRFS